MSLPHWSAGVQRRVLANGLTLLVQHVPDLPAVAVVTRVRAGFFDEPDHWAGISHVLEHMFFKGTPTRGVGEIARETKNAGGYLNAGTSYDYTTYYTVLPVSGLADAIDIQADALRNALLDADELSREIVVIIEEAKRKLDTPSSVAQETLHALLYDHHRIRRWRIGSPEGLRALTRDDLAAYYRSRYVPANTIVAISGGMDADEAMALAARHYADWPSAVPAVDRSPAEPPRRLRKASTVRGDVQQSDLVLGWRGVPARHPDELALDLAASILAAGRASRLYRGLRETGIAASVGAYNYSPTEVGVFAVSADLDPGRVAEAVRAIAEQVHGLREAGPSPLELERARTLLRARWARRFESADGRASELASAAYSDRTVLWKPNQSAVIEGTSVPPSRSNASANPPASRSPAPRRALRTARAPRPASPSVSKAVRRRYTPMRVVGVPSRWRTSRSAPARATCPTLPTRLPAAGRGAGTTTALPLPGGSRRGAASSNQVPNSAAVSSSPRSRGW